MSKTIKIQSLESGNFNPQNNKVHFQLPDGSFDLTKSYIQLNGHLNTDTTAIGTVSPVYNYIVRNSNEPTANLTNGSLVKNVDIRCDKYGQLESIKNGHILFENMHQVSHNLDDMAGEQIFQTAKMVDRENVRYGIGLNAKKEDSAMSTLNNVPIQIPLSSICGLGQQEVFNTVQLQTTTIGLELDVAKLQLEQLGKESAVMNERNLGVDSKRLFEDCANTATEIRTENTICQEFDLQTHPYYVGQPINIYQTHDTGNVAANVITSINIENDGDVSLELAQAVGAGNANLVGNLTNVAVQGYTAPSAATMTLETAELVLQENADMEDMDKLQYFTYTNESDNGNGLTSFKKSYYVEPECVNVIVAHTDEGKIISRGSRIEGHRISVDNEDVAGNRTIDKRSPLYHDLINKTITNMKGAGFEYRNAQDHFITQNSQYKASVVGNNNATYLMCSPVPQTLNQKLLGLDIEATGTGVKGLEIFKQVVRTIEL